MNASSETVSKNLELTNLFNIIQTPIYNSLLNKNMSNPEIINCIDLNITNFRKYFPMISSILKDTEYYKEDLLYDFIEIRSMSTYLFDNLEKVTKQLFIEIETLNQIYNKLVFVDKLLEDFNKILQDKNNLIKKNISSEEFNKIYELYKIKLEQDTQLFYEKYYEDDNFEEHEKVLKLLMSKEFIKDEFKQFML